MLSLYNASKIYVCKDPIDMRNGFEGLSSIVVQIFSTTIISGGFFVFFNKRKNLIKILHWDMDGPVIWYKRLEKGKFLYQKSTNQIIDSGNKQESPDPLNIKDINLRCWGDKWKSKFQYFLRVYFK